VIATVGAVRAPSKRVLGCAALLVAVATAATACGSSSKSYSATDASAGVTIKVSGAKVTVARSGTSTAGTGGGAGQVACVDDYHQLATATSEPAPDTPWYAATLITWPNAADSTTATLSHALDSPPDLCIAQMSDGSAQAVAYFRPAVKSGIQKTQQSSQAKAVLQAVGQTATQKITKGAFPGVSVLLQALTASGMYATKTATLKGVTDPGTLYILTSETTDKQVVAAIMDNTGTVSTVTQGLKGAAKIATVKPKKTTKKK